MSFPQFSLTFLRRCLFGAVVAVVPLASFLSFSVQPLAGKLLLPMQGGAAPTWLGTMLFFQVALLLGYGWAAWLLRRRAVVQVATTVGLCLAAMFLSRLPWVAESHWIGLGGVFLTLTVAVLPAMVLLFGLGPIMHGWLRRRGQEVPYYLYAFSNAGGLAAVLLYPFTIERGMGLSDQMVCWQMLLCLVAVLAGVAGFCYMRSTDADLPPEESTESISARQIGTWLGLSALTCAGMLGATNHLTAEIGSSPLAWVGPFGAFLLSFLVIFSGGWQPRFTLACLGWLVVSLAGFMVTKGVRNATVDGPAVFWLMSLTASASFFGNALLHAARPAQRFAFFYLVMAAGGVLGGLFASFGAPFLFLRPSEFLALSSVLLTIGVLRLFPRREVLPTILVIMVVLVPILGQAWRQTTDETASASSVRRFRNIYGWMMLEYRSSAAILTNGTTTHDSQMIADADSRRHPTLYYSESSGVGRTIQEIQKVRPAINVGAVGLGAGTLAAYARAADTVDFWDIDPKVIRIAHDFFTYISDSPGKIHVQQADGRKGLEASSTDYDLIVIDAFTGDAIPPHLLTREALAAYAKRLEQRQGLLVIHISNRYNLLFPIIAATAHTMGWAAINVLTEISKTTPDRDWDADGRSSQYVVLCRFGQEAGTTSWFPADEDDGRVKRQVTVYEPQPPGRTVIWTDDRHAAIDSLQLRQYLLGK